MKRLRSSNKFKFPLIDRGQIKLSLFFLLELFHIFHFVGDDLIDTQVGRLLINVNLAIHNRLYLLKLLLLVPIDPKLSGHEMRVQF